MESKFRGPVQIYFGGKDPLLRIKDEKEVWKKIFPQAEIRILSGGSHFIHLERKDLLINSTRCIINN